MPHVSTMTAYEINVNPYIVTGNKISIQELDYYKYMMTLSNNKHINIAHPNETYTDLFLHN